MFYRPSVFCHVSLARFLKYRFISVSACLEHVCWSKQTKEGLHNIQNFLGCSLGKIFVLSQCCLWVMLFYLPKKLCDMTHFFTALLVVRTPCTWCSIQGPAQARESPNSPLFLGGDQCLSTLGVTSPKEMLMK